MTKAIQAANVFIEIANNEKEGSITNLKLNKLLYYAQGWSLARTGKPLFDEDILAWQYGPIVGSVYHRFSVCGSDPIASCDDTAGKGKLSEDEIQLLIDVYRRYGCFSASALVEMTHRNGTPWQQAYTGKHNAVIDRQRIKDYFSHEREPLTTFTMPEKILTETIGRKGSDGITILPCDGDEDEDDYE